jgi:hypothetical protein
MHLLTLGVTVSPNGRAPFRSGWRTAMQKKACRFSHPRMWWRWQMGGCLYIRMGTTAVSFKKVFCAPTMFPACVFNPVEWLDPQNHLSVRSLAASARVTRRAARTVQLTGRGVCAACLQVVRPGDTEETQGVFILRQGFSVMVSSNFNLEAGAWS